MSNERLIGEWAARIAREAVAVVMPCLRPEEVKDAFEELHRVARQGVAGYALAAERMGQRLSPAGERRIPEIEDR